MRKEQKYTLTEEEIGFKCNQPGCDWEFLRKKNQEYPEYHTALRNFGKHNIDKHGGRIDVHMVPIIEIKKVFPSN